MYEGALCSGELPCRKSGAVAVCGADSDKQENVKMKKGLCVLLAVLILAAGGCRRRVRPSQNAGKYGLGQDPSETKETTEAVGEEVPEEVPEEEPEADYGDSFDYEYDEEIKEEGQCGETLYSRLYEDGHLAIFGKGQMWDYELHILVGGGYRTEAPWGMDFDRLEIARGVTSIGNGAFSGCEGLRGKLTIPEGVTSIGDAAFGSCMGLDSVVLPASLKAIGIRAFDGTSWLTSFSVAEGSRYYSARGGVLYTADGSTLVACPQGMTRFPAIDPACKRIGDNAFFRCEKIRGNLTLPEGVETVGDFAFYGCDGLVGVPTLPESLTQLGLRSFGYCGGMEGTVKIPSGLSDIGSGTFDGCRGVSSFEVSAENPYYSSYGGAVYTKDHSTFVLCAPGVTELPEIHPACVKIGEAAFENRSAAAGVLTLPDGLKEIGDRAFYRCSGITGPLKLGAGVTRIGAEAFCECTGFTGGLTLPDSVTEIGDRAFMGCSGFTGEFRIGAGVTWIGEETFCSCSGFTGNLALPADLAEIASGAFSGCSGFTGTLSLPDGLGKIGEWAFSDCSGFTGTLSLPDGLVEIGKWAFSGCSGFTGGLTLPAGLASVGAAAFSDCGELYFAGAAEGNRSYTVYNGILYTADGKTLVQCPGSVKSLPEFHPACERIGEYAFYKNSGTEGPLTIPQGVTEIGENAFYECSGFTGSLTIPEGVTTIGEWAFAFCDLLFGAVTIPASVTYIGEGAFDSGFAAAYFYGDLPETGGFIFERGSDLTVYHLGDKSGWDDDWYFEWHTVKTFEP